MREPYVFIEIVGGIVQNIHHNNDAKLQVIVQTSDDSLLDASLTTWESTPTKAARLDRAIANVVRILAKEYGLAEWTGLTKSEIVDLLLTGQHNLHAPSIDVDIPEPKEAQPV
jgi:hypothetical protein